MWITYRGNLWVDFKYTDCYLENTIFNNSSFFKVKNFIIVQERLYAFLVELKPLNACS